MLNLKLFLPFSDKKGMSLALNFSLFSRISELKGMNIFLAF